MTPWNELHYSRAQEFARLIAEVVGRPPGSAPPMPARPIIPAASPLKPAAAAPAAPAPAPAPAPAAPAAAPASTPAAPAPAAPAKPVPAPTAGAMFNKMPWKK